MASKAPVMVATVNADTKNHRIAVVVEHEDWQSFSRAVRPRATKAFKRWIYEHVMFGQPREVASSLAWHTVRDEPKRCISVLHFTY